MTRSLGSAGIIALVSSGLFGQSASLPSFEAASVRPADPKAFHHRPVTGPERFSMENVSVKDLVFFCV